MLTLGQQLFPCSKKQEYSDDQSWAWAVSMLFLFCFYNFQEGLTALHRAAFQNHLEFAKMLIDTGRADLKKRTQVGLCFICEFLQEIMHDTFLQF